MLAGEKRDRLIMIGIAHQHGQGHGLSQGPAQTQHQGAENAPGSGGQHHFKDCLPAGGSHAVGRFLDFIGDGQ